jgi:hypothetical protein
MTLHLYFILKISANLFGSLELVLSSQPSFENLQEFGLRLPSYVPVLIPQQGQSWSGDW